MQKRTVNSWLKNVNFAELVGFHRSFTHSWNALVTVPKIQLLSHYSGSEMKKIKSRILNLRIISVTNGYGSDFGQRFLAARMWVLNGINGSVITFYCQLCLLTQDWGCRTTEISFSWWNVQFRRNPNVIGKWHFLAYHSSQNHALLVKFSMIYARFLRPVFILALATSCKLKVVWAVYCHFKQKSLMQPMPNSARFGFVVKLSSHAIVSAKMV